MYFESGSQNARKYIIFNSSMQAKIEIQYVTIFDKEIDYAIKAIFLLTNWIVWFIIR